MVEVWDPVAARTRKAVGVTDAWPVARGNLIVWSRCESDGCDLHLTDVAGARDRAVQLDSATNSLAISPDGSTVAAAVLREYRNAGDVELVDVATGRVRWLYSSWMGGTAMAWARSGDHIFLVSGFDGRVWMYGTRDLSASEQLRLRIPRESRIHAIAVL
jgi:hypothetical protein